MFFQDRNDAGKRLVSLLDEFRDSGDALVLGLPRGGVVVALEVAKELNLPLDVWVTRKIRAPFNQELAIGSVDSDGNVMVDENTARLYEITDRYIKEEAVNQAEEIKRRYQAYRGSEQAPDVKDKTVIVVDDGVATGYTMMAALKSLKNDGAAKIICAVPVASPRVVNSLRDMADSVQCLSTPSYFSAVGEFYRDFTQVTDDEVMDCLQQARSA